MKLSYLDQLPNAIISVSVNKYGFPRTNKSNKLVRKSALVKSVKGFKTGDIVKAVVTKGKHLGTYLGKVSLRSTDSFNIKTVTKAVQGINHRYCKFIHQQDGSVYGFTKRLKSFKDCSSA